MSRFRDLGAMPWDHNAIRIHFDGDEPPALVFNEKALPGALVSWAWSQLMALNSLLDAIIERRQGSLDGPDIAGAVQTVLMPVINALEFSEERAHQLQTGAAAPQAQRRKKRGGKRRRKTAA